MAVIYHTTIKATAPVVSQHMMLTLLPPLTQNFITDNCKKVTKTYQLLYNLQEMITSAFKNASQHKFLYTFFYMLMTLWPVLGAERCHQLCNIQ
jgi:hypothetical protein